MQDRGASPVKGPQAGADLDGVERVRRPARLLVAATLTAVALAGFVPPWPARAETVADARAAVAEAQQRVDELRPQVRRALRAYESTLGALAAGVTRSIQADQRADAALAVAAARERAAAQRVRALYIAGGANALVASVLDAGSAGEAMRRVGYVRRLVEGGTVSAAGYAAEAARLQARASTLERAADGRAVRAADVQQRYEELAAALAAANAQVRRLSDRARDLQAAQDLLAQIAALNAAVDAAGAQRVATARATGIPPLYRGLYERAARTCPGMSWTLLAAVGQVESGHGANPGTSYAGAQGPMQFMPATFAAYGVDGDGDGDVDIQDPADSVFSAANYLCANGAGRVGEALERAVWNYNHAEWYVQLVLKLAGQYAARDGA